MGRGRLMVLLGSLACGDPSASPGARGAGTPGAQDCPSEGSELTDEPPLSTVTLNADPSRWRTVAVPLVWSHHQREQVSQAWPVLGVEDLSGTAEGLEVATTISASVDLELTWCARSWLSWPIPGGAKGKVAHHVEVLPSCGGLAVAASQDLGVDTSYARAGVLGGWSLGQRTASWSWSTGLGGAIGGLDDAPSEVLRQPLGVTDVVPGTVLASMEAGEVSVQPWVEAEAWLEDAQDPVDIQVLWSDARDPIERTDDGVWLDPGGAPEVVVAHRAPVALSHRAAFGVGVDGVVTEHVGAAETSFRVGLEETAWEPIPWREAVLDPELVVPFGLPRLEVGDRVDLACSAIGEATAHGITLANRGAMDLVIEVGWDGDGVFEAPDTMVVPAGSVASLPVTVRAHRATPYQADLVLQTNDPAAPVVRVSVSSDGCCP